jgi:hypothetical protein
MKTATPEPVPGAFTADPAATKGMSAKRAAAIQSIIEQGHAQSVAHALFKWRAGEFSLPD